MSTVKWIIGGLVTLLLLIVILMAVIPTYRVWSQEMRGKAAFAEATHNRRIAIEEAMALRESAVFEKEADSIRAEGIRIADGIVSESMRENGNALLQYKFIEGIVANDNTQVLYVPMEGGLPVLEFGRRP